MSYYVMMLALHTNTAVEGVCVTGAAIRLIVPVASKETVPVASRYGACFCRHGRNNFELDECRGTSLAGGRLVVPVQKVIKWALVQCRGTNLSRVGS